MKKTSGVQTFITVVAVLIIFAIAFTDKFSITLILPVLGGFCVLHGIIGFIKQRAAAKDDNETHGVQRFILQLILGGFIFMLGIIEITNISLPANFWNIVLIIIVVIALLWMLFKNQNLFKK